MLVNSGVSTGLLSSALISWLQLCTRWPPGLPALSLLFYATFTFSPSWNNQTILYFCYYLPLPNQATSSYPGEGLPSCIRLSDRFMTHLSDTCVPHIYDTCRTQLSGSYLANVSCVSSTSYIVSLYVDMRRHMTPRPSWRPPVWYSQSPPPPPPVQQSHICPLTSWPEDTFPVVTRSCRTVELN